MALRRDRRPARSPRRVRAAGAAVTSFAGAGAGTLVSAAHGSTVLAVLLVVSSQLWMAVELGFRCWLRWRHYKLQEDIIRAALQNPENECLRTLLVDVASTHLEDLGDRLPVRAQLDPTVTPPKRSPELPT